VAAALLAANPSLGEARPHGCPFCAGREHQTPHESAVVLDANGQWQVRVVPNKYPAVALDQPRDEAFGVQEVIIEAPGHALNITELSVDHLTVVLTVYRDRLRHWARDGRFSHALIFKNAGYDAGASLEHVHSQMAALPYVVPAVQAELDGARRFHAANNHCVYCALNRMEAASGQRLVAQRDGYVLFTPFAPRQPYETWILPEKHSSHFERLTDAELKPQAEVLRTLLIALDNVSPGAAYNLILHTAPFGEADAAYHWHWELIPRLTHEAGLEWGAGVHVVPQSPERAAAELRSAV
jgi:UDPglucose--hexose-1-phosphate uridylyltransferase